MKSQHELEKLRGRLDLFREQTSMYPDEGWRLYGEVLKYGAAIIDWILDDGHKFKIWFWCPNCCISHEGECCPQCFADEPFPMDVPEELQSIYSCATFKREVSHD